VSKVAQLQIIPLADLLADGGNPRLTQASEGQRDTLRALAVEQGRKLVVLARDIIKHRLNPADPFYVIQLDDGTQRFVVLEGNRRLAALRALENPDLFDGAVKANVLTLLRRLGKRYREAPIENVQCALFRDREEANHWIELRHTGFNSGAGIVKWGSDAASRFKARIGGSEGIETQAYNFLERRGDITPEQRRVGATTLQRLLQTPRFREKVGLGLRDGRLTLLGEQEAVAKTLHWIVDSLVSRKLREPQLTTIDQRNDFANSLPPQFVVASVTRGTAPDLASLPEPIKKRARRKRETPPKPRSILIPTDCVISITDERLRRIERELRRLDLEDFTNAVGVLLRVFIELSADAYIDRTKLAGVVERDKLTKKLQTITKDLVARSKLIPKQAKPVLKACEKDSLLAPSIGLMNEYVHNPYMFPSDSDLRTAWDNLQPFVIAVWTP
jgi:hypothetical protein